MKIEADKWMKPDQVKALLRAPRQRVRMSAGGDGPWRQKGAEHPNARRDYALLSSGAMTGIRVSEIIGFRVGDVRGIPGGPAPDERPGKIRIRRAKKKDRETGEPVYEDVVLPEPARRAIVDYLAKLAPSDKEPHCRVFPVTTRQAERIFKYYAKRAGLSDRLTIHSLRHSYGVELYRQHRDLELVRRALGHSDIKTTQVYMHAVDAEEKLAGMDFKIREGEDAQQGAAQ